MEELVHKIRKGYWQWPSDVKFSIQGLAFLNQTLQFDPNQRLSWPEIANHPYFTTQTVDQIPLEMIFQSPDDDSNSEGVQIQNKKILINTKNPRRYQEMYAKATSNYF